LFVADYNFNVTKQPHQPKKKFGKFFHSTMKDVKKFKGRE